jgi:hypothetical protein
VQELDFPGLTVEDVKLKVHIVRTGCAAELAKIIKSKQSEPALQDVYVPKLFCCKQAVSFLCGVCVPRTSMPTKVLYVSNICTFTD